MRIFLSLFLCVFSLAFADDSSKEQEMQQAYTEFVQLDAQIEGLLKQKMDIEGEIAQHVQREESSPRPRVDRRQGQEIQGLVQQLETTVMEITKLDQKRALILQNLNQIPQQLQNLQQGS